MEFTKATYRRALRLAENEVASRADILQWAKDRQSLHYSTAVGKRPFEGGQPAEWFDPWWGENQKKVGLVQEARTDYFRALDFRTNLIRRAKREGYVR